MHFSLALVGARQRGGARLCPRAHTHSPRLSSHTEWPALGQVPSWAGDVEWGEEGGQGPPFTGLTLEWRKQKEGKQVSWTLERRAGEGLRGEARGQAS